MPHEMLNILYKHFASHKKTNLTRQIRHGKVEMTQSVFTTLPAFIANSRPEKCIGI